MRSISIGTLKSGQTERLAALPSVETTHPDQYRHARSCVWRKLFFLCPSVWKIKRSSVQTSSRTADGVYLEGTSLLTDAPLKALGPKEKSYRGHCTATSMYVLYLLCARDFFCRSGSTTVCMADAKPWFSESTARRGLSLAPRSREVASMRNAR